MEFDVAVLGGGPAGYTAAIRAAQLGARVACIEKEAELGGTCLRVGCIPTKAWVQTAHALHAAREIDPKLGVVTGEPELDFAQANEWKAAVVKQMTGGVASLFKANDVTWFQGAGRFDDARSIAFDKGEIGLSFSSAIVATGSYPDPAADPGARLAALRRLDRAARADRGPAAARRPRRRDHRLRVRLDLRALRHRGDDRRDARRRSSRRRTRTRRASFASRSRGAGSSSTSASSARRWRTPAPGSSSTSARARRSSATSCSSPSAGRRSSRASGSRRRASTFDPRTGIGTDAHRRTSVPHIYAAGDVAGYWQLAHTAFREGEIAAENATGHEAAMPRPGGAAADLHRSRDRRRRAHRGAGARSATATRTSPSAGSRGSRTRARSCPARRPAG